MAHFSSAVKPPLDRRSPLEWRILSDLAWTIRYGRFFPGQAYADRDPRDFLYTALNFSF